MNLPDAKELPLSKTKLNDRTGLVEQRSNAPIARVSLVCQYAEGVRIIPCEGLLEGVV